MRFVVGIDLGTTNSCVAYVDLQSPQLPVQNFRIPQVVEAGLVQEQWTLPSFCYLASSGEFPAGALQLPWKENPELFVGTFARDRGAKVPTKLIASAKSWLCHSAANRREAILPFEAADDSRKMSPVTASSLYLSHIKEAWNAAIAKNDPELELEQQEVILTIPASFDETARVLTVEASKKAGFLHVTLLEEPQAAFYSWIAAHENEWESLLKPGQTVLVVDVGGGTTDFSLIEVQEKAFARMAVGNHLLLGGDNMDVAIAHLIEQKLPAVSHAQWLHLRYAAREAKERLMAGAENYHCVIQGTGSSVVQGSLSCEVKREEVLIVLKEGFFGIYPWEEALQLKKTEGLRAMGLAFESEPSITKQMAAFLKQSQSKPDFVLFNGGAMKPEAFQQAILEVLHLWHPDKKAALLKSVSLDQAVARGAAYYGKARRGLAVKIGGGTPRSYYLAVHDEAANTVKALTLMPRGAEEGDVFEPQTSFLLQPNAPVSFQLYTSHTRLKDNKGDLVIIDPLELQQMPAIQTILRYGKKESQEKIPVVLKMALTAVGTLELALHAVSAPQKWNLEFQLRSAEGQDNALNQLEKERKDETFHADFLLEAKKLLAGLFENRIKPSKIMEELEKALGMERREWPPSLLRGLFDALMGLSQNRKLSVELEARFWNLAGFLLRPGYGYPLDDFRMKEMWKLLLSDGKNNRSFDVDVQKWILYRRLAGGFTKGQQHQLANELLLLQKGKKANENSYNEQIRALGALELMEIPLKVKLGTALTERIAAQAGVKADYWALARIGGRQLLQGSAANVVPRVVCEDWLKILLQREVPREFHFVIGQLCRKTDHKELNISRELVAQLEAKYPALEEILTKVQVLNIQEKEALYGENLPVGLTLS